MVFHWSLSDNLSPQVSRTFPSILVDLSNVVAWIVSTRPLITKSSSLLTNHLVTTKSINYNWYKHHFDVPQFFQLPRIVVVLILLFRFLSILLFGQPGQESPQICKFSFFL